MFDIPFHINLFTSLTELERHMALPIFFFK